MIRLLAKASVAVVLSVVATLAVAGFASAAFPGHNGRIAFQSNRDGDYEIFTMKPNGTHLRQITHNDLDEVAPAFSPNGAKIAFEVGDEPDFQVGHHKIFTMSVGGRHRQKISNRGGLPDWQPVRR